MSGLDSAVLGITLLSALLGVWRGFVREALSLVIWGAAFVLAYLFGDNAAVYLEGMIQNNSIRMATAFITLFLSVHIAGFFITRLAVTLIKGVGLRSVDRVAGAGFGIARGIILITVAVFIAGLTPVTESPLWQESVFINYFVDFLAWLQESFPFDFGKDLSSAV